MGQRLLDERYRLEAKHNREEEGQIGDVGGAGRGGGGGGATIQFSIGNNAHVLFSPYVISKAYVGKYQGALSRVGGSWATNGLAYGVLDELLLDQRDRPQIIERKGEKRGQ